MKTNMNEKTSVKSVVEHLGWLNLPRDQFIQLRAAPLLELVLGIVRLDPDPSGWRLYLIAQPDVAEGKLGSGSPREGSCG